MSSKVINFRDIEDEVEITKTAQRDKKAIRNGGFKAERRCKRNAIRQRKGHNH